MKKLKTLGLAAALTTAALLLASCGKKEEAAQAPAEQPAQAVYVKAFNSTDAFTQRYTNPEFDFNAALPLSLDFVELLNTLSNSSAQLENLDEAAKAEQEKQVLAGLYQQFNSILENYKANPDYKAEFEKAGLNVDVMTATAADLTLVLDQLNKGCQENNNYQADEAALKALKVKNDKGEEVELPAEELQVVTDWNANFLKTCSLTADLYKLTQAPDFSYEALAAAPAEEAKPEEAAPAEEAKPEEAPAEEAKPEEEKK